MTKCCEVKTVEAKKLRGSQGSGRCSRYEASAAVSGSGQAAVTKQTITQSNTQSVGAITGDEILTVAW